MVLLSSEKSTLFEEYPHFSLNNSFGDTVLSQQLVSSNGLLVVFTCNHCPYAIALWDRMINDYSTIQSFGFEVVAINPNINPNYPDDSPENMKSLVENKHIPFEYLVDEDQSIASQYDAKCTPDFFLLNPDMNLLYRGAYDDNWKDETAVTESYILKSMEYYQLNQSILYSDQSSSMGCSIKWT